MTPRKVRVVAALITDNAHPEQYLVQQRLPGRSRALLWEFPGGKVEAGESDEQALARECQEELAVDLSVGRKLWEAEHAYSDLIVVLALYAARITFGVPKPLGANALRFCSPSEMLALPFCDADIPLLQLLAKEPQRFAG
ncbi:MAG: (deoxy)nucleoside triphosphate pyrophosphohydrolase [Myxococcaceae bacterium]